jgi:hypothetical protein
MLWLTEDAVIVCAHELGQIVNEPTQNITTVEGRRVLVAKDPEGRSIRGCPNVGAAIRPCLHTLAVKKGYSTWITVEGHSVCLDTLSGLTDGTPPATVLYKARHAGQSIVGEL